MPPGSFCAAKQQRCYAVGAWEGLLACVRGSADPLVAPQCRLF
jgi:hypothetical protein